MRTIVSVAVALPVAICSLAFAGDSRDRCGVGDYHQTPFLDWTGCDGGRPGFYEVEFTSRCLELNKTFGTKISCTYDKKSFEDFYRQEAKKPKAIDRYTGDPSTLCGMFGIREVYANDAGAGPWMVKQAVVAEFKSKVKSLKCAYDANEKRSPSMELKGSELVIHVRVGDTGVAHGSQWAIESLRSLFPTFKSTYDENH